MRHLLAAAFILGMSGPAFAQHAHGNAPAGAETEATRAFKVSSDKMHKDMAISYSGDADIDFARMMIPHHQAAIDMAKIALAHAKDPGNRKLAEEIVKTQAAEIGAMRAYLAKRGEKP